MQQKPDSGQLAPSPDGQNNQATNNNNKNQNEKTSASSSSNGDPKVTALPVQIEVPKKVKQIEILSTGLPLLISVEDVEQIWKYDKPKMLIVDLINELFKKKSINKNFETLEVNIVAQFQLYSLIFAKQQLYLDDRTSAILVNLLWSLLIYDNSDYGELTKAFTSLNEKTDSKTQNKIDENKPLFSRKDSLDGIEQALEQQNEEKLEENKEVFVQKIENKSQANMKTLSSEQRIYNQTPQGDFKNFKEWVFRHHVSDRPFSLAIFDFKQVEQIITYSQTTYFSNFYLYSLCLRDKHQDQQIIILNYIDTPTPIPPLSQALFMGKRQLEIQIDEDEENPIISHKASISDLLQNQAHNENDIDNNQQQNKETEEIKRIVQDRISQFNETVTKTLQERNEANETTFQQIVNPKKQK